MTDVVPENQPTPDAGEYTDATRDAILAKYSNDPAALAKGYHNSTQEFQRKTAEFEAERQGISNERADWVAQKAAWETEKAAFTENAEAIEGSNVTAAGFNLSIQQRIQAEIAESGEVSTELKAELGELGFQGNDADEYIAYHTSSVEARMAEAATFAPQGTDPRELLKFVNSDLVQNPESADALIFSEVELNYLKDAADRRDYGKVVPVIEEKYLAWVAENDPKREIAQAKPAAPKPRNFKAQGATPKDAFGSFAEWQVARKDPRYNTDYVYRQEVDAKHRNSDLEAFNAERMQSIYGKDWDTTKPTIRQG